MIRRLSPLFSIPPQNPRLIDRLDFRADLQRGDKGVIYAELATLLNSGTNVLRRGLTKNNLSADERDAVKKLHKRFKHFFASNFSLKERKERAEKKKSPYNPLIKEKDFPQRIEKENRPTADAREDFRQECLSYIGKFDEQQVADFYFYWSESTKRGKMRFEGRRYWNTETRLKRWVKNHYTVDDASAALRLERLKARQGTNRVAQGMGLSEEEQRQRAAERERADREREAQHERDRQQAVSFEEWQRMREKEAEEDAPIDKNDASDETG